MPGIGILTNPNSRRNRRDPGQMRRLGYILGDRVGDRHEMTKHPDDIYKVAERFLDADVDVLALNGGDGTNHVTLTTFFEVYGDTPLPKIALLRGGTMNTISNAIGIRGAPGKILLNISEKYYLGQDFETTKRNILCVEYGGKKHYGFIYGNGVINNYLEAYYQSANPSPWVAFTTLARAMGSAVARTEFAEWIFSPFRAKLTLDGEPWEVDEYKAVVASTIEQIGLGFRPFIRCRETPGHFHILGILAPPWDFVRSLHKIRLGMPVPEDKILSAVAQEVTFESDQPIPFTIDGDLHTSDVPVTLSTGPQLEIIIQ